MRNPFIFALLCLFCCSACQRTSLVEQHRTEKHMRDSIALADQERSLHYYQSELERLQPEADSLLSLFRYERNEKYQDHGFYVTTGRNGLKVMVRDDGKEPILLYREGKRLQTADDPALERANHLLIVIHDIRELEIRIARTSLEIQKYQRRLEKN